MSDQFEDWDNPDDPLETSAAKAYRLNYGASREITINGSAWGEQIMSPPDIIPRNRKPMQKTGESVSHYADGSWQKCIWWREPNGTTRATWEHGTC